MDGHGKVRMSQQDEPQPEPQDQIGGSGNGPQVASLEAGTQAPPVDTKSKGGRPRIHPDRKAYKAQKERERRARPKLAKQSEDQK